MIRIAGIAWLLCSLSLFLPAQEAETELPSVLILGDSISIGYTPLVRKRLAGVAGWRLQKGNYKFPVEQKLFDFYVRATGQLQPGVKNDEELGYVPAIDA